jgi:tetratricopeptide (TPR) repeat protein
LYRIVIILLFAAIAFAQSPLAEAVGLARAQRYQEARTVLRGSAEPDSLDQRIAYHRLKAAIASGLHEAGAAVTEMRIALDLAPQNTDLMAATAAAELQAGQLDQALAHAQGAGNLATAKELLGDIQEKRHNYVDAAKAYQDAIALAPDREQYRVALALELIDHQTFPPAIAVLKQAAPLFPKSGRIRALLGVAQYAYGEIPLAIAALTEAVTIDPKLEPAYLYLSRIVLESSAAPPESTIEHLCGWNKIVCSAVKLRVAREKDDAALQSQAIAGLKEAPQDDPVARCELGRAYVWSNEWTQARAEWEACVRLDPSPPNYFSLGRVYGQLGLTAKAHEAMEHYRSSLQKISDASAQRLAAIQGFEYLLR